LRFRCGQAHAWSSVSLLAALAQVREEALSRAARALAEEAELARNIADRIPASAKSLTLLAQSTELAQQVHELQVLLATNGLRR